MKNSLYNIIKDSQNGDKEKLMDNEFLQMTKAYMQAAGGEEKFYKIPAIERKRVLSLGDMAFEIANVKYPKSAHNSDGDALRHGCWSAYLTKYKGAELAEKITKNYEALLNGQTAIEKEMDSFNNEIGRKIALNPKYELSSIGFENGTSVAIKTTVKPITDKVQEYIEKGRFKKIENNKLIFSGSKFDFNSVEFDRTLRKGDWGYDVKKVQMILEELGFQIFLEKGYFNDSTYTAVVEFQGDYGLDDDGAVGKYTKSALLEARTGKRMPKILKKGRKGRPVSELRKNLELLGYDSTDSPGVYGRDTYTAVFEFQEEYGISANGVAESETLVHIKKALAGDVLPVIFKIGRKGPAVKHLQNILKKILEDVLKNIPLVNKIIPEYGVFGLVTLSVVKLIQTNYKLPVTGEVGQDDLNLLNKLAGGENINNGIPLFAHKDTKGITFGERIYEEAKNYQYINKNGEFADTKEDGKKEEYSANQYNVAQLRKQNKDKKVHLRQWGNRRMRGTSLTLWQTCAQVCTDGIGKIKSCSHQTGVAGGGGVDAEEVPYIVLPYPNDNDVAMGDLGIVIDIVTKKSVYVVYAERGNEKQIGEMSIAAFKSLGIKEVYKDKPTPTYCQSGKTNCQCTHIFSGKDELRFLTIMFPGSGKQFGYRKGIMPTSHEEIKRNAEIWCEHFKNMGYLEHGKKYMTNPSKEEIREMILKRAKSMIDFTWTPQQELKGWKFLEKYKFPANKPVRGIPYSQTPRQTDLLTFKNCLNKSDFYNGYTKMPLYGNDCSGFVSFAWGTKRKSTEDIRYGNYVNNFEIGSKALQPGDAFVRHIDWPTAHTFIYAETDSNGDYVCYEQTPGRAIIKIRTRQSLIANNYRVSRLKYLDETSNNSNASSGSLPGFNGTKTGKHGDMTDPPRVPIEIE